MCTPPLLHTDAFTHRRFYSQTVSHTDHFTHRCLYTQTHLHTHAHTHATFYTRSPKIRTNALAHKETFTSRPCYIQTLLHGRRGETSRLRNVHLSTCPVDRFTSRTKTCTKENHRIRRLSVIKLDPARTERRCHVFILPRWSCHQTFRFPHSL